MKTKLLPYAPTPYPLELKVECTLRDDQWTIEYELRGSIEKISLLEQPLVATSTRTDNLWQDTCFEWFIKSNQFSNYWEFNAAPTGAWNFYSLDDYRSNLKNCDLTENPALTSRPPNSSDTEKTFIFSSAVSLKGLFQQIPLLKTTATFAITTVIRWKSGEISYFALQHPNEKPDFHHPLGFTIPIGGLDS